MTARYRPSVSNQLARRLSANAVHVFCATYGSHS